MSPHSTYLLWTLVWKVNHSSTLRIYAKKITHELM